MDVIKFNDRNNVAESVDFDTDAGTTSASATENNKGDERNNSTAASKIISISNGKPKFRFLQQLSTMVYCCLMILVVGIATYYYLPSVPSNNSNNNNDVVDDAAAALKNPPEHTVANPNVVSLDRHLSTTTTNPIDVWEEEDDDDGIMSMNITDFNVTNTTAIEDEDDDFYVEPFSVPRNKPKGYFNYDINDGAYGPNAWGRVDTSDSFMKEFGPDGWGPFRGYASSTVNRNRCSGRPAHLQSPKNLEANTPCEGHHEIRTWCGQFTISQGKFDAKILPNKLSLQMNRRPCGDVTRDSCNRDMPPLVDYPRYTSRLTDFADLLHYDIKVPAEHEIEGEKFDAEIQMLTLHPGSGRIASIGIVVRARSDGYNAKFQDILNAFQRTYDANARACNSKRRQRRVTQEKDYQDSNDNQEEDVMDDEVYYQEDLWEEEPITDNYNYHNYNNGTQSIMTEQQQQQRRNLRWQDGGDDTATTTTSSYYLRWQENHDDTTDSHSDPNAKYVRQMQRPYIGFDPFHKSLWPSIYFYRYDGTITEPPCTGITWFVMQRPMIISRDQLAQIKRLLFTHRDGNCRSTSVHNANQSVARPVFRGTNDQSKIENCLQGTFKSDVDKGRLPGNRCRA
ncbi:Eukaryotic-type carbonic anhydrase [Nitzschia inconspicua]|uniref:Eukaryotic-type carbonic anhydrase n=1 Tax=Nitzschia inconspicua TaxID=303405 RepID=A0A9K3LBF1_9STRA|nr:Eukaryotic-type carbonic anhydrase [Nitzschia inconspicua]KAG7359345.1 Eukaryotic-type carbonic anhydrase [Nitzschia inconspicua]